MGWCLFLLAAFAVYGCIACQSDGSSAAPEAFSGIRNAEDLINSMFKQLSCNGQNCGGYDEPEDEVTIETQPVYPDTDVYEPQYHPQHQTTDKIYVDKPDICESIKEAAVVIESKHPDIANVKTVVMKELVRLTVLFSSVLESEDCHPTVKLLDFIALSAEKLKLDYIKLTNNTCVYGEMPVDIGTTAISTHSYEQVSEESYPGATSKQPHHNGIEYQTPETMTGVEDESYPENSLPETSYETTKVFKTRSVIESHKDEQSEEIIAEEDNFYPHFVGSVRGVPGEHYPNYSEIPITSFSCSDKYIPGFYADLETGCQVFHVCYEHRRESFLCPVGTIFNQPILACDYWYSSNCSLAPSYYGVNVKPDETSKPETDSTVSELISNIIEGGETNYEDTKITESELDGIVKFLPVQVKVFEETSIHSKSKIAPHKHEVEEVASEYFDNILSTATHVVSKTRDAIAKIPEPVEVAQVEDEKPVVFKPKIMKPVLPVIAIKKLAAKKKIKLAAAAVPIIAKAKIAAAVPVAKVVAAKAAAVPVAKVVAAKAAAVPVAKVVAAKAAAVPVAKVVAAKAAAVPVAKVVAAKAAAIPVAKVVAAKAAAVPVAKVVAAKAAAVPVAKVVAAKAAAVPVAKVVAAKAAAVPVAKVVAAKAAAVPVAKVVAAKAAAVPVSKAAVMKTVPFIAKGKLVAAASKKAVKTPILKAKILTASLPFAKSAILKSTIPVKGKLLALPLAKAKFAASVPLVKANLFKAASVPLVKAKLFKAASISPLTKKALALGYIKLLKAKKLSLIG